MQEGLYNLVWPQFKVYLVLGLRCIGPRLWRHSIQGQHARARLSRQDF